jgi:hypothetical protein
VEPLLCGHSSRRRVAADAHQRPTRRFRQWLEPPGRAGQARNANLALGLRFPPYLVLLRVGFTLPPALQPERCALTAPFHPYPGTETEPAGQAQPAVSGSSATSLFRSSRGVAEAVSFLWHWPSASLEARIPDVIRHTALRSSDFPPPAALTRAKAPGSDRPVLLPEFSLPRIELYHAQKGGKVRSVAAAANRSHPTPLGTAGFFARTFSSNVEMSVTRTMLYNGTEINVARWIRAARSSGMTHPAGTPCSQ